jgi:hypothetical protein
LQGLKYGKGLSGCASEPEIVAKAIIKRKASEMKLGVAAWN